MPIYEYICGACGHDMEVLQKMSDSPLSQCPNCHADELKKKISAAGFRLAGGGWYETDFKKSGQRNLAGDAGGAAAKSSDGGSAASGSGKSA